MRLKYSALKIIGSIKFNGASKSLTACRQRAFFAVMRKTCWRACLSGVGYIALYLFRAHQCRVFCG